MRESIPIQNIILETHIMIFNCMF